MRNTKSQNPSRNIKFNDHKHRAENKDNLDHREGEEQMSKGDASTHNRKEQKSRKDSEDRKDVKGRH